MMDFTAGLPSKHEKKHESAKRRFPKWMLISLIVTSAVAVGSTALAGVYFMKYSDLKKDPSVSAQNTKQKIMDKVGTLYDVPKEDPTMAEVTEVEKLKKEQDFFKSAQNGDYVLVYPNAKLGILYRESTNKIVNVGPVSTGDEQQTDTTSQSADETQDQQ